MSTEIMKKLKSRQRRTLFLSVFAAVSVIWAAIYIFDINKTLMLNLLFASLLFLLAVIFLALFASLALGWLRKKMSD